MKTRILAAIITLCFGFLLCQTVPAAAGVKDVNGHWAQIHIEKWVDDGIIKGYPDGQFKPDEEITRAEFVALVNRAFKIEDSKATEGFSDVRASDWFYAQVMSGKEAGYIAGYPDGTFKPDNTISRQEAAALITKLLNLEAGDETALKSFGDYLEIDKWATSSINAVIAHGIMNGFPDKTFAPQKNITRAEAVVTLERSLNYPEEIISVIKGTVKMENQPVKGAVVKIFTGGSQVVLKDTITDEKGTFSFAVPKGQYDITAVLDKNVGYASTVIVNNVSIAADQEILLAQGVRVSGTLVDKSSKPLAKLPFVFTTNPSFVDNTNNNGDFSVVLPLIGNDGQSLFYSGYFYYNGVREGFIANQQFSSDTDLGQVHTNVSAITSGGGGGGGNEPPADPGGGDPMGPENDLTVATTLINSTAFLYTGEDAIQKGVVPGTIEEKRVAVLRGKVFTRDNAPLEGVRTTILNHPEFGNTVSRSDGYFDMAVNGGGVLTVRYEKVGFITAQRQVNVPWQDFTILPDVVLIPYDSKKTEITLDGASPMLVAQGSQVTDKNGSRQATLLFPAGVKATLDNGPSLDSLTVRATEYTVGDNGPQAMPAVLPPNVGYTYCVEYSADEAVAAGAKSVTFDKPIIHYVENFIGFHVGSPVPMGYYDLDQAAWIPSKNGLVVKILSIADGMAELDITGTGTAADASALASLGVTDDERRKLADLYKADQTLWRVPITHFTPFDCNWPYGPPLDAERPNLPNPKSTYQKDPCKGRGSIIEYQNQILGESASVYGTPFSLVYNSGRAEGYENIRTLLIPLSGASVHKLLKRIELEVSIAGQLFTKTFAPTKDQSYSYTWDGKDVYGRTIQGNTPINVRVGYVYPAIYMNPPPMEANFGSNGIAWPEGWEPGTVRQEAISWQEWTDKISFWDNSLTGVGGWSLDVHHSYDPSNRVLYFGDGSQRETSTHIIATVAGDGTAGYGGEFGSLANAAKLNEPMDLAIGPDGTIYIADAGNNRIRRIDPDGKIYTETGSGTYYNDGQDAWKVAIERPDYISVNADNNLYFTGLNRIRRIYPSGTITTVAGNGTTGSTGDGGKAKDARVGHDPGGVAVGPDGALYIADPANNRIRRIGTDEIMTTVAGRLDTPIAGGFSGDGGPASLAQLNHPLSVALGPDGSLYIADSYNYRIRRVSIDGMITTVAGKGTKGYSGDGGVALDAEFDIVFDIEVGLDGSIYIADTNNNRIRRINTNGIIDTVAGNGKQGFSGDGGHPLQAALSHPYGIGLGPDGSLYIADTSNHRIRRVGQPIMGSLASDLIVANESGTELYIFDGLGRHQKTINALTGSDLYVFNYDGKGLLIGVTDAFGNATSIMRDAAGNPQEITAPGGQKTFLEVNKNGYLSSIACPYHLAIDLEYGTGNLLTTFSDHKGNKHMFTYDGAGLLIKDQDPAGGYTNLSRSDIVNGFQVKVETAMGRISTYGVTDLSTGGTLKVNTDANGGQTKIEINKDGSRMVTYPDGTQVMTMEGPDPRPGIGMQVPITTESTIITPDKLASKVTRARALEMTDPSDISSITKITDTVTDNGRIYTTIYDIDKNNKIVTVTNRTPSGKTSITTMDWHGRVTKEATAGAVPKEYNYNDKGQLTKVQQGAQSVTYTYDDMNRVIALMDASDAKFEYTYNDADVLKSIKMPGGQIYKFGNDKNGNVTKITMPKGDVHELGYTVVGQPDSYTPPGNAAYQKTYNLDRDLTKLQLPDGREAIFTYDTAGRITGMSYLSGELGYIYNDSTDRVKEINRTGDEIKYIYTYDGSLITQMAANLAGSNYTYDYTYDNNFNLIKSALTSGGEIAMTYDSDGLLTNYGNFSIAHEGPLGAPSQISTTGMSIDYTYDTYGRPTSRVNKVGAQQIYSLVTSYDNNTGIIDQNTETVANDAAEAYTFTYDSNKQLTGVAGATSESHAYDANGNRTTGNASYDAQDRLTQLGDVTYTFNDDGFLSGRGADTIDYTAQGELRTATVGGKEISYRYDGLGRRVGRSTNTGTVEAPVIVQEKYLYGNLNQPYQMTALIDNGGNLHQYYYDQFDCLFSIKQGATWYYVATDHQGTPKVVSDASGAIVKKVEYDSYGKLISDSSPAFQLPIGYAGGISDPDTKLVHFGMRDYDPAAGRWTARDPVLFDGQQGNLYVYVANNPMNLRDPSGLFCIGGSAYVGFGGGGQFCFSGEGMSLCAEVGFGVGNSIEVSPFAGIAADSSDIGIKGGLTFAGFGPGAEIVLNDCGGLKFTGDFSAGPASANASYDFLDKKWGTDWVTIGKGEGGKLNAIKGLNKLSPKMGGSIKLSGRKCVQF